MNKIIMFLALLLVAPIAQAKIDIQHWTTEKGLDVYFYPAPDLPMLDMRLVFRAGSAYDGDKFGVAKMTAAMMDQGAGGYSVDEMADRFSAVGAQFGSSSMRDMAWVSLRSLTSEKEFNQAFEAFLLSIEKPDFPQRALERLRQQVLIALQQQQQAPGSIAKNAFFKALYRDHPYAHPEYGNKDTVSALARADIQRHFVRYYVNQNAVLAMVGAISREQAEGIAERVSKTLGTGEAAAALPEVKPLTKSETIRIDFPSAQSHIYMGHIGMKRGDADYFSLYKGNHVLGGSGFSSRLVKEVRVKRGFSYSVYSYFLPMMEQGPFQIGLQTRNDQVEDARRVVLETVDQFIQEGPTHEEFAHAEKNIIGGFPLRVASNSDLVEYLSLIGYYQLPLTYLDEFQRRITDVSIDEIKDAFKRRVNTDKMITVIVGGKSDQ